jgi:HEAT repeat protein
MPLPSREERERQRREWEQLVSRFEPESTDALMRMAQDKSGDEHERAAMVRVLGDRGDWDAFPLLIDLLESDSSAIRDEAALGLELAGDQRAFVPLLRRIRELSPAGEDIGTLVFALSALDYREAVVDLVRILVEGNDANFVPPATAATLLGEINGALPRDLAEAATAVLTECLAQENIEDWKRAWSQDALEHIQEIGS